ncbi:DUF502 domain-containing protein [Desulfurivibrio alkaliphilus]|uniref:DUF502 domain-containing protein n=1 Tax=Desulfurivibrio alkaliphilus (strain DSM 19089 / UNIQEM U267 / AHT2) TaxID=589865 RepID=D6Z623_DESAT|nr:DUF502 domain-containing protein [Desulfurivibrio alkaliphilus]ADH84905.1 protein of unknown function DUF502 [Desulfurivibrio alkaliphilus AHT 2]
MKTIGKYFLHGLLFLVPLLVTLYVLYLVFATIDGIFPFTVPGAGFLLTIGLILAVGFVTSNLLGRGLVQLVDRLFARLPLVALLYTSLKDLVNAFVGDKKSFNRPVEVALDAEGQIRVVGFITREDLERFGLKGQCAVYLPQSYNFAGNMLVVPHERVRPINADPAEVMKLIVSGGVSSR